MLAVRGAIERMACRSVSFGVGPSRRTGRGSGYGLMPKHEWRYGRTKSKAFTKLMGIRYGIDTGLKDKMLILSLQSSGHESRRLDDTKRRQLSVVLEERLVEAICTHEMLAKLEIRIMEVKVSSNLMDLHVKWLATDDVMDAKRAEALADGSPHVADLKRAVTETLGDSIRPTLHFQPDMTERNLEKLNELFAKADYGVDYRTLSSAAKTLGSGLLPQSEEETQSFPTRREAKPPKFLEQIARKRAKKEAVRVQEQQEQVPTS